MYKDSFCRNHPFISKLIRVVLVFLFYSCINFIDKDNKLELRDLGLTFILIMLLLLKYINITAFWQERGSKARYLETLIKYNMIQIAVANVIAIIVSFLIPYSTLFCMFLGTAVYYILFDNESMYPLLKKLFRLSVRQFKDEIEEQKLFINDIKERKVF